MKKKFVVMLSLVLCLLLSISLAACKDNTPDNPEGTSGTTEQTDAPDRHEAKSEWMSNETKHWHECAAEGHTDKLDEADHSWNDGKITTEPTETAEGVKTYTCTVCGATKTESVKKPEHTHTFDTANWETSDTHHWHKATCSHTEEVKDKAAHAWNGGEVTTEPTYTADGVKTFTCTVCGATKTESEPKLSPKDNTITVGTIDFTYNAKSQPIDSLITADNKAGMVIKYVGVDGTTYAESTTAPTNAGSYQYTITIPATTEWKSAEKSGKFTINKYELTVLYEKTHTTKEYDGNAMILVEYKSLEGTDVNIVIFMKSKDVGTEIDRIQLPGLLKDNYTYDQSKVKAEITPKVLSGFSFGVSKSELIGTSGTQVITLTVPNTEGKVSVNIRFDIATLTHEGTLTLITGTSGQGEAQIEFSTEEGDEYKNYAFASSGIGTLTLTTVAIGG